MDDAHLNTRSIENIFAGLKPPSWFANLYSICVLTLVVCVLKSSFLVSSLEKGARYPMDPQPPTSCVVFTRS